MKRRSAANMAATGKTERKDPDQTAREVRQAARERERLMTFSLSV